MFHSDFLALTDGQPPQLLLLDLDGTLIDSVPDLATAVDAMLSHIQRPAAGVEKIAHWIGNGADRLVRRALADGDDSLASRLSDDEVAQARQVFDRAYLACLHRATGVFPGVASFLDETSGSSTTKMVLITNKPRQFTEPLIASLGWRDYFEFLVCGDDLAEKKPSPMPLLYACERTGIAPECTIMIGDSCHDIGAAKSAGIVSVGVTYGYNHGADIRDSQPELVVDSFTEFLTSPQVTLSHV